MYDVHSVPIIYSNLKNSTCLLIKNSNTIFVLAIRKNIGRFLQFTLKCYVGLRRENVKQKDGFPMSKEYA